MRTIGGKSCKRRWRPSPSATTRSLACPTAALPTSRAGTAAYGWNGTRLCEPSPTPRSNIPGTNGGIWCLGLIADALGWKDAGLESPQLPYQIVLDKGRMHVLGKDCEE